VLILDEPTSVLTPSEADEVMTVLRRMVDAKSLSVLLITHKLREVIAFADEVTVMRRGRWVATQAVREITRERIAELMMGNASEPVEISKAQAPASSAVAIEIQNLSVRNDVGTLAVRSLSLRVNQGEILGIAGISGNGQRELVQAIGGQRGIESGQVLVSGERFSPDCETIHRTGVYTLPEEPLPNATVPGLSVAENLALRTFHRSGFLLNRRLMRGQAMDAIETFSIRPPVPELPVRNLSGGNVQRVVLARDLGSGHARIMIVANPCFGLDFAATAFVHNQLLTLRNGGGAVLLISEDLEELLKLADRILVMSNGRIVHEDSPASLDVALVGRMMAESA
jgi:simple sugar transport system ATP-binding protein